LWFKILGTWGTSNTFLKGVLHKKFEKYYVSGHNPSPCFLFKTERFEDWILSPSSGGTYSVGPNQWS
jgi:hypothetical protein